MARLWTEAHGYQMFDVISALQKDIRRGNEENAMYWCMEMIPKFEMYLWRRLMAILNEDIGIANPMLLSIIPEQRRMYFEMREIGKDGPARLALANAILLMCRSPKTRLADHFQRYITQRWMTEEAWEIPDYAFDHHTGKGKRMGRTLEFWLKEGCLLIPKADIPNPYEQHAAELWNPDTKVFPDWPKRRSKNQKDWPEDEQLTLF